MENNVAKKSPLLIILVAILVVVIGIWIYNRQAEVDVDVNSPTVETQIDSTEDIGSTPPTGTVSISYTKALQVYKDKRIQLGVGSGCPAHPRAMTFKNNTTIMIDNRAPIARTFKLGTTYSIKAYGFRLINLSSDKLPATWLLDCDKQQNVATVTLQK
ncbi:MAG: hypothetical protein AAB477_00890 [Patescibacteria group bacterium]